MQSSLVQKTIIDKTSASISSDSAAGKHVKSNESWSAAWQCAPSLSDRDRNQLIQLIRNEGFLTLPTAIVNEMAVDGFCEEIEVVLDEVRHQVKIQNINSEVFAKVKQAITRLVPIL